MVIFILNGLPQLKARGSFPSAIIGETTPGTGRLGTGPTACPVDSLFRRSGGGQQGIGSLTSSGSGLEK